MRLDYDSIGKLADEIGCNVTDLIAMTPQADPFYVGAPAREEEARWFAGLWERFGWGQGMHLRRAHYRLVVLDEPVIKPTGDPYVNDGASWGLMKKASLAARYLNLIPVGSLVDRKNPDPIIFAQNKPIAGVMPSIYTAFRTPYLLTSLPSDIDLESGLYPPSLSLVGFALDDGQPYLVEIWIEKTTQNDILVPLARKLGVNLVPGEGDTSEIRAREAIERAIDAGRPMRILYISDFDPRGHKMPVGLARKIEFMLRDSDLDLDITLEPIALTQVQSQEYNLPRKPFEKGGAANFEKQFGEGGTELDALEALYPGELARIVEREVCRYIDPTLTSRCRSAYWDITTRLRKISKSVTDTHADAINAINDSVAGIYSDVQDAIDVARDDLNELQAETDDLWRKIADELEEQTPEIDPSSIPSPRPADPVPAPLFNSRRTYLEQMDAYRRWQGKSNGKSKRRRKGAA